MLEIKLININKVKEAFNKGFRYLMFRYQHLSLRPTKRGGA
jgi:hypothetical protein